MSKQPGIIVETKDNKKGIIYRSSEKINGKSQVHIIDEKFELTGEKLLISDNKLYAIGYQD